MAIDWKNAWDFTSNHNTSPVHATVTGMNRQQTTIETIYIHNRNQYVKVIRWIS